MQFLKLEDAFVFQYISPEMVEVIYLFTHAALYQQSGEKGSEMENLEYQRRKVEDLQQRLAIACSSIHHNKLVNSRENQFEILASNSCCIPCYPDEIHLVIYNRTSVYIY